MRAEDGFQPKPFPIWHPYTTDLVLPGILKRLLPEKVLQEVEPDLIRFGDLVNGPIRDLDSVTKPPTLTQYDQWGRRVDRLHTSEGWRALKDICVKEGLVAIPHERRYGEYSRLYGFAKAILLSGEGNVIMCPFSMTDGAARVIELSGTEEMKRTILPRLICRDPSVSLISGQWMTERSGGSDVSQTETIAKRAETSNSPSPPGALYYLDGFKWFSSATDADMALALARTGSADSGSRGLSLFVVPTRFPFVEGFSQKTANSAVAARNGILLHRLKDKLGTKIVPTAELSLNQSEAYQIGQLNEGVKTIAPVLNITRVHSATGSVGYLGKCLSIARAYSTVRAVDGGKRLLQDVPVHTTSLAKVSLLYRRLLNLLFGTIHLLGKVEAGTASPEEEARLRLLTPVVKAFSAEKACGGMEECMAALGGQGYMEENTIARLIRDGLVEKIWEGTVNVLAMDLVRGASSNSSLLAFSKWVDAIIAAVPLKMRALVEDEITSLKKSKSILISALTPPVACVAPKSVLILFGQIASTTYLLEHAAWAFDNQENTWRTDVECFNRSISEEGLPEAMSEVIRLMAKKPDVAERIKIDRSFLYGSKL